MTIQITIVGTGQIGTSFGLALGERKEMLLRVGYDIDQKTARAAEKIGAFDRIEMNLHKAVREASLILLCVPVDQIYSTMKEIAPFLKEGAVVMETGLAKEAAASWAHELFPEGRHYIGLTPILSPAYLQDNQRGIEAAHADLFKEGLLAITAPATTDSGAIKLASDLARLVGANSLFIDPMEIDGLMSATHLLPQLSAAALLQATVEQPGWMEARKVAGRMYAKSSEPLSLIGKPDELEEALNLNRLNLVRTLDNLIAVLTNFRTNLEKGDRSIIMAQLTNAYASRKAWWAGRSAGDWIDSRALKPEMPEDPGFLGRLIGIGGKPKKKD